MEADILKGKTLAGLKGQLKDLPVLPAVVVRLMSTSPESDGYFDDVLSLAEADPPLAARVLTAANSASSAPIDPICELPNAVARLGARRIGEIVTGLAVTRVFVPTTDSQRRLWVHSLTVAAVAREIARQVEDPEIRPDQTYLAGLLHDIGRFVMFDESPDELGAIDESGWETPEELVAAELEKCGFDHAELGWHACVQWGVPEKIGLAVRDHHMIAEAGDGSGTSAREKTAMIIQLADAASMVQESQATDESDKADIVHLLRRARIYAQLENPPLSPGALAEFLPGVLEESRELAVGLGLNPARGSA